MNPYTRLASSLGTQEATALAARLSAWHDAMVAHERRLRTRGMSDVCDEDCAHAEARALWPEVVATFGTRAHELTFLRSRAHETRRLAGPARTSDAPAEAADHAPRRRADARGHTATVPADGSAPAAREV